MLEAFKDIFASTELTDPANSNNVVSRLVGDSGKSLVVQAATTTFNAIKDSDDAAVWQEAFENNGDASKFVLGGSIATAYSAGSSFQPTRPWRGDRS